MNDIEIIGIDTIILYDDVFEERSLDQLNFKGGKEVTIEVYSKEGDFIPHFHFYSKDKKIDGCLQIFKPEYFIHGKHTTILNNNYMKQMITYLSKYKYKPVNNWQRIVLAWYDANRDGRFRPILKVKDDPTDIANMPDYAKLLK